MQPAANAVDTYPHSSILDLEKLQHAPLMREPYEYLLVRDFIRPEWQDVLMAEYPSIAKGGSFPLSAVKGGVHFDQLIAEFDSPAFRAAIETKFGVNLAGRPSMFTVRGRCRARDGKIHTDTASKIITILLYMNPAWQEQAGGKLRILRSGTDIEDYTAEVSPVFGSLLVFKRCDHSFHGHLPYDGERRVIQMNFVTEQKFVDRERKRHLLSFFMKRLGLSY